MIIQIQPRSKGITMKKLIIFPIILASLTLGSCNSATLSKDLSQLGNSIFSNTGASSIFGKTLSGALSNQEISAAFKEALNIGTGNVVGQLSANNGFNLDPKIHIPLPQSLATVQNVLGKAGLSFMLDDLETRLNRAAEIATPHAKELFMNAISEMSFDDVMAIYKGPQDSATTYFRNKMSNPLAGKINPFVNDAIAQAGVISAYDNVMDKYKNIPFMPDVKSDLTSYVVDQGIDGIFFYLAEQEKAIRQDPVKQTTALLKRVFGNQANP